MAPVSPPQCMIDCWLAQSCAGLEQTASDTWLLWQSHAQKTTFHSPSLYIFQFLIVFLPSFQVLGWTLIITYPQLPEQPESLHSSRLRLRIAFVYDHKHEHLEGSLWLCQHSWTTVVSSSLRPPEPWVLTGFLVTSTNFPLIEQASNPIRELIFTQK